MSNEYERRAKARETGNGLKLDILFVLAIIVGALFGLIWS